MSVLLKTEYLKIVNKLHTARYSNIKRSGTIICRCCNNKSKTPTEHVEHVGILHKHLLGICPYCQREPIFCAQKRISKSTRTHLKFCCFFHKIENSKYRRIFNSAKKNEVTTKVSDQKTGHCKVFKMVMFTQQRLITNSRFLLNALVYKPENIEQLQQQTQQDVVVAVTAAAEYSVEIDSMKFFHKMYTLQNKARSTAWWTMNVEEFKGVDKLVATNIMRFDDRENIDCNMIRILSLQWHKYNVCKLVVSFDAFFGNIEMLKMCIKRECFIITRYMRLAGGGGGQPLLISAIVIKPKKEQQQQQQQHLCSHHAYLNVTEIDNFDAFVDACYENSNNDCNLTFPSHEHLQILAMGYQQEFMVQRHETISLCTNNNNHDDDDDGGNSSSTESALSLNVFFSPLSKFAKVYFYSQTQYGCVRAFDRLLCTNNLATLIENVVHEDGNFYINYSSLKIDKSVNSFCINLHKDDVFPNENFHRANNFNSFRLDDKDHRLFKTLFLDKDNFKFAVSKLEINPDTDEDQEDMAIFPDCLLVTNIKYKLTPEQVILYKVVQFHREKIILEMNSLPQLGFL